MADLTQAHGVAQSLARMPPGCLAQACHILGLLTYAPDPTEAQDAHERAACPAPGTIRSSAGASSCRNVSSDSTVRDTFHDAEGRGGTARVSPPGPGLRSDEPWDEVLDEMVRRSQRGRPSWAGWKSLQKVVVRSGEAPVALARWDEGVERQLQVGVKLKSKEGGADGDMGQEGAVAAEETVWRGRGSCRPRYDQRFATQRRVGPVRDTDIWSSPDALLR